MEKKKTYYIITYRPEAGFCIDEMTFLSLKGTWMEQCNAIRCNTPYIVKIVEKTPLLTYILDNVADVICPFEVLSDLYKNIIKPVEHVEWEQCIITKPEFAGRLSLFAYLCGIGADKIQEDVLDEYENNAFDFVKQWYESY